MNLRAGFDPDPGLGVFYGGGMDNDPFSLNTPVSIPATGIDWQSGVGISDPGYVNPKSSFLDTLGSLATMAFSTYSAIDATDRQAALDKAKADAQLAAIKGQSDLELARTQATIAAMTNPRPIFTTAGGIPASYILGAVGILAAVLILKKRR